jgi:hypothetical protein
MIHSSTTEAKEQIMNQATRDIMALLKVDADTALKVQSKMWESGFDFSEATKREFNREVKICFELVKAK